MTALRGAIAGHPIASFLILAFSLTWALTGLLSISILFGLVALFGPAAAALIVAWAEGTTAELRDRITHWRAAPALYVAAFAIPFAVAGLAVAIRVALGDPAPGLGSISAIEVVIFALVIGEEIGWRGFLMPRLRARMGLAQAGLLTGVVWTLWHLPMYLQPGTGLAAYAAFAWWVVPFAVVLGAVAERARYSVLVATVMHGAANIATPILLPGVDRTWTLAVTGAIYLALAVVVAVRARRQPVTIPERAAGRSSRAPMVRVEA